MILRRTALVSAFLLLSPAVRAGSPELSPTSVATPRPPSELNDPIAHREMQVHFLIASEYYKDGNYPAAIAEWRKVLKIQPNHALAREKIQRAEEKMAGH